MKVDVTRAITTIDGQPVVTPRIRCEQCGQVIEGEDLTIRKVIERALMSRFRDEQSIQGEEMVERYDIALRVHAEDIVDLSTKEAALIQKLIVKPELGFFINVVAQVTRALEGEQGSGEEG